MSILSTIWRYVTGGTSGIVNYCLLKTNDAIASITPDNKAKIQAALNIASAMISVLLLFKPFCKIKWQTAYGKVIDTLASIVASLEDLRITPAELSDITAKITSTYDEWNSDDDDTCKE